MDIRQLRAFLAIAESGTFSAAALRVHVTQAAISMQIRQLEEELGVRLFTRLPRKVLLTEAGEILLTHAQRILHEHDVTIAEMAELAGAERGRLRVGSASTIVSAIRLPLILKELLDHYPRVDISALSGTSETLVNQILTGELDVAFVSLPVEIQGIKTELLSSDELIAIASPNHPLAKQRVVTATILASEKLILGERGGNTRRLIDLFFTEQGVQPNVIMELSRVDAIKQMVKGEMGVSIVPSESARDDIARGELISWWIKGAKINWELGLATLNNEYQSPVLQTFIKLCRKYFPPSDRLATSSTSRQTKNRRAQKQK
jgi:LysR family transcriptional regulator, low CO2-responsive transcriptional regulator